jgi:Outer membrane protein beta-barrel family/CarboxypepD_reg-like domain
MHKKICLKLFFVLLLCLTNNAIFAQVYVLKGNVFDATAKVFIGGASISITKGNSPSFLLQTISDTSGHFEFKNLNPDIYTISISNIGYEKIAQKINLKASNASPITFSIKKEMAFLDAVVVTGKTPPIKQKGDTTEFSASQFKVNPDATAEDLIKKLPGITVAKDGTVTSLGEQVRKVTVDGKDFFGDDATAALRNLPAEVIEKIQVFDKLSDQAQLSGFDEGNSVKTVNIVTKNGIKNGQFGRLYAGAGTDNKYAAGGNISFFEGNRRISLVGNFNNINQQNFSNQDLLGAISTNTRSGNKGGGANSDNFLVGQASGISTTNALGINYSNQFGKKLTVAGSYFFNNGNNENENIKNTQTFYTAKDLYSYQKQNSNSFSNNHRINAKVEYKLDSANTIFIVPSISFQTTNTNSTTATQNFYGTNDSLNSSANQSVSDRHGYNIRNSIMLRHAFKKRGRSITIGVTTAWSKNDGDTYTSTHFKYYTVFTDSTLDRFSDYKSNGKTLSANIAYTEPMGKKANLQIDFTTSSQKSNANQETFKFDGEKYSLFDNLLSNLFDNNISTNNGGINYRNNRNKDEQFAFGLNMQNSNLESQRIYPKASAVKQSFFNFLPNANYRKKIGMYDNIKLLYRASTVFPSITQLQDVVNLNNPLRVSSGNPDLKPSYTHFLSSKYSHTNTKTSRSFFANLILQTANNYISTGTFLATTDSLIQQNNVLKKGSQYSKPINLNGYKNLNTFFTFSTPVKFIKSTINLNTGFNYSKYPGFTNNIKTFTNSYAYNVGVVIGSNISEYIDFNFSYNANWTKSKTTTTNTSASKYLNQSTGLQLNLLSKKGAWFLQNDVSGNIFSGLSSGFNNTYWLWNAATGKKIFKKHTGEIKLTVFDLLKQNQSITRNITGSYIQDVQTQILKQYFMLTFTYKLKNFGSAPKQSNSKKEKLKATNKNRVDKAPNTNLPDM